MTEENENIEIQLDPIKTEEPDIEIVEVKTPEKREEPAEAELSPEDGIRELQLKLEAEKNARFEAERRAQMAYQQANQAKNEVDSTNLHLITNAIETVKRNNDILKMNYSQAMSAGDYDKAAEYQSDMSSNHAKLLQLENGKRAMQERPKQAEQPAYQQQVDLVESLASRVTPQSAQWLRQNKASLNDPRKIERAMRAHADAMEDGVLADSPEYFQYIENRLGMNKTQAVTRTEEDPMSEAAKPMQRRQAPPAAPVTRSGNGTGSRPNVVRLTSDEREMASMMGMTDKEYALNKIALQKAGKL
jgi:hypothetical protein